MEEKRIPKRVQEWQPIETEEDEGKDRLRTSKKI
jgi:hypothetical protein